MITSVSQKALPFRVRIWIIFVVLLWSGNALTMPTLVAEIPPLWAAALRFSMPLPILFFYFKKKNLTLKINKSEFFKILKLTFVFVIQIFLFHNGALNASGGRVALFVFSFPVLMPFIGPIFNPNEKINIKKILGSFIGFSGLCVSVLFLTLSGSSWNGSLSGDLTELLSSFMIAISMSYFKKLSTILDYRKILWWQFVFGSICFFILAIQFEKFKNFTLISKPALFSLTYQITITGIFCWLSQQYFLSKYNSSTVTVYYCLIPIFSIFLDILFNSSQIISFSTIGVIVGTILTSLGIFIVDKNDSNY